jgi:hypothetical protein
MYQSRKQVIPAVFLTLVIFLSLLLLPLNHQAKAEGGGSLYFLPATGSFEIGKTFSVRLVAKSDATSFNLVEANLAFSNDTLQVTSLSKSGSIVQLWFTEPTFSNAQGTISASGGVPNPGYTGAGRIITINFKARAAGDAWVKINSGQILANDGQGTDILSSSGRGSFTVYSTGLPQPKPVTPPAPTTTVKISSSTHPTPEKWYNTKNVLLSWTWLQGITNYSYIFDHKATTIPDNVGEGMNTSVAYNNVDDGEWYFHLKAKTGTDWMSTIDFKINIDSIAPQITKIDLLANDQIYNLSPKVNIEATDDRSGIDYYTLKVDDAEPIKQTSPNYDLKDLKLSPGAHQLTVQAFDLAGNIQAQTTDLYIELLPAPVITYYTKQDVFGYNKGNIKIRGTAVPMAQIDIPITGNTRKTLVAVKTQADQNGNWAVNYTEVLMPGKYSARAIASYQGQVSQPSKQISFEILSVGVKIFGYGLPQNTVINIIILLSCCVLILLIILILIMCEINKCTSIRKYILSKFKKNKCSKSD